MRTPTKALLATGWTILVAALCTTSYAGDSPFKVIPRLSPVPANPRMSSDYYSLVQSLKSESKSDRQAFMSSTGERATPIFRAKGEELDQLESYVWLESWDPEIREAVAKAGAEIVGADESRYLVQAWIPLDAVEAVAAVPGVRQLRRPSYGYSAAGAVNTEGDPNLWTTFIRSIGHITGAGVRVGVLSSGLFNRSFSSDFPASRGANKDGRVTSGDLPYFGDDPSLDGPRAGYLGGVKLDPANLSLHDVNKYPERDSDGDSVAEGAAILEVIHDVAPDAKLYFGGVTTDIDLTLERQFLLGEGVDIIVDDMVFYDSGRFDGTSAISRAAQKMVLQNNVVYIVATGNQTPPPTDLTTSVAYATKRFPLFVNGYFSPLPGFEDSKFHNFAAGRAPQLYDRELTIAPVNRVIDVVLVWDDVWDDQNPSASDDLDLILYNYNAVEGDDVVAASENIQNGNGLPVERITQELPYVSGGSGKFSLVISRKDTRNSAPVLFSLVILQGAVLNSDIPYLTHGISGNNGDALPPVITVGAVTAQAGTTVLDGYTVPGDSPGPGRAFDNSFVRWFTDQKNPAVVSYTDVATRTVPLFTGTSAAAAHIGGLTALLRHNFGGIPAWEFYSLYRETTAKSGYPNATILQEVRLSDYQNPPTYYRVNGYDTWKNLEELAADAKASRSLFLSSASDDSTWESSDVIEPFNQPLFQRTAQGLAISPGGEENVFGFWQTPILNFKGLDGVETTQLRSDRVYEVTARVGTNESDPLRVPDFRLRVLTGLCDEAAELVINGRNDANAPTTIGGEAYRLYYRPSNDAVAAQGMRFAFDLIHFNPADNSDAILYLQDVTVRELELP